MAPLSIVLALSAAAGEGMWRPEQVTQLADELHASGLQVDPGTLADLKNGPLAAVVDMDYCTGAFVSPDGLVATAYHCVTDGLQFASKGDEDLFAHGFYAKTRGDERWAGPNLDLRVTISTTDVGQEVVAGTRKLEGPARLEQIETNIKALVARCEAAANVHCEVATYGQGDEYQLIEQREFRDARLVFAPPLDVGYFGGDADNWQWPRHSGDFAFLRVYSTTGNEGAPYSSSNVPYHPPKWLPTAPVGPKPGDFVMVPGYPGGTYRWRSAAEFDYALNEDYPRRMQTMREVMALLQYYSDRDPAIAQKVAPRIFLMSNDVLYLEGNLAAFKQTGLSDRKWGFERDLGQWIAADPNRADRFGDVLDTIGRLQAEEAATAERDHVAQQMREQVLMVGVALDLDKLADESRKPDKQREPGYQNRDKPTIEARFANLEASYDFRVDRAILRYFLERTLTLPPGLRIPELDAWFDAQHAKGTQDQKIEVVLDALYENVELADADRRRALMDTSPWFLTQSGNPWFGLAAALQPYFDRADQQAHAREADWRAVRPRYIAAVEEFVPTARPRYLETVGAVKPGLFYHDANETLRWTFGKVDGYVPRDGLIAAAETSVTGITEKNERGSPYEAPPTLLEAIRGANWGPYASPVLHSVAANYVTTLDTARGSSGSPTLDAQGRWVGIIFDGNYESMAADWIFDDNITRSIHTDVDYVLWYLDAVAGADDLLKELGIEPKLASVEAPPATKAAGEEPLLFP